MLLCSMLNRYRLRKLMIHIQAMQYTDTKGITRWFIRDTENGEALVNSTGNTESEAWDNAAKEYLGKRYL